MSKFNKQQVPKTSLDSILEWLTWIGLASTFIYLSVSYSSIPAEIGQSLFNGHGTTKNVLWFPPVIVSIICWGIFKLNQHPELLNFPSKPNKPFRTEAYHLATQLLRWISFYLSLAVLAMTIISVKTAIGSMNKGTGYVLPIIIIVFVGTSIFYAVKAFRLPKNK